MSIYLASRSPRRRQLLEQMGVAFDVLPFRDDLRRDPETDETPLPGEAPVAYVERIARAKAAHGWRIMDWRQRPLRPLLAADTTLELAGEIIGKPQDAAAATTILRRLSGQTHRVLTAVAVRQSSGTDFVLSISEVRFRHLSDDEIGAYVSTGEPLDKAGAYGIQGRGGMFVAHLAGSFTGVMGLPVCETGELLKRLGCKLF